MSKVKPVEGQVSASLTKGVPMPAPTNAKAAPSKPAAQKPLDVPEIGPDGLTRGPVNEFIYVEHN